MSDIYTSYNQFKKVELIYINEAEVQETFSCEFYAIKNSCIIVKADKDVNENRMLPRDVLVQIKVYLNSGIYTSETHVLEIQEKSRCVYYILQYPNTSEHHQRREFYRADIQVPVAVTVVTELLHNKFYKFNTRSKNICGNGICFVSESQITDNEAIYLAIDFVGRTIEVSCELIHSKSRVIKGREVFENALKFTDIKSRDVDFIVQKCFQHQLRGKEAL